MEKAGRLISISSQHTAVLCLIEVFAWHLPSPRAGG